MDLNQMQETVQTCPNKNLDTSLSSSPCVLVSLETEIPEALYKGMKDFLGENPHLDQYEVMSSALANFLYQNGCSDRAVTEKYLNDLFTLQKV